jgi:hypothetical protein
MIKQWLSERMEQEIRDTQINVRSQTGARAQNE